MNKPRSSAYLFTDPDLMHEIDGEVVPHEGYSSPLAAGHANAEIKSTHANMGMSRKALLASVSVEAITEPTPGIAEGQPEVIQDTYSAGGASYRAAAARVRPKGVI